MSGQETDNQNIPGLHQALETGATSSLVFQKATMLRCPTLTCRPGATKMEAERSHDIFAFSRGNGIAGKSSLATTLDHDTPSCPQNVQMLVSDASAEYWGCRNSSSWTEDEKGIFLRRYVQFGKNFRRIAVFLQQRTARDVKRFYRENRTALRSRSLKKIIRRQGKVSCKAVRSNEGSPRDSALVLRNRLTGLKVTEDSKNDTKLHDTIDLSKITYNEEAKGALKNKTHPVQLLPPRRKNIVIIRRHDWTTVKKVEGNADSSLPLLRLGQSRKRNHSFDLNMMDSIDEHGSKLASPDMKRRRC